jgi:hypothetical protein
LLPPPPLRLLPGGAIQFPGGAYSRCSPVPFHGARVMDWLHQLANKPRDYATSREHFRRYSVFYRTFWITDAELLVMFESP